MNPELAEILIEVAEGRLAPARELASIVGRSMAMTGHVDRTEWASKIAAAAEQLDPKDDDSESWATF
jgi:hypothetical protein